MKNKFAFIMGRLLRKRQEPEGEIRAEILPADEPQDRTIGWVVHETVGMCVVNSYAFLPRWRKMMTLRYWTANLYEIKMSIRRLWFKMKSKKTHREMVWPRVGMYSCVGIISRDYPLAFGNYCGFDNGYVCANMWAENMEEWARLHPGEKIEVTVFDGTVAVVTDERMPVEWLTNNGYGLVRYGISDSTAKKIERAIEFHPEESRERVSPGGIILPGEMDILRARDAV